MKILFFAALLLLSGRPACAAPAGDLEFFDFERASLDDILNIRTRVASRLEFSSREAPGIVTVITRAEILNSGARNLVDVLRLVPGLDFGVDVESTVGIGIRGNWAYEGKILVLVDGQRYNEPFMGTAQLIRISPEQVEKIEIIRGPGSAVYGGFAALGVIKITTRSAKAIDGTEAAFSYGYMAKTYGTTSRDLAFGKAFEHSELTIQAFHGSSNRSDRRYTDFNGAGYSMKDAAKTDSKNFNLGLKSDLADLRLIADQHRTTQQDHWDDSILPRPLDRNFDAYFAEASREFRLGENLTLTPSFEYSFQEPFNGFDAVEYPRDKSSHFSKITLLSAYSASERLNFSGGAEFSLDKALLADTTPAAYYFRGGRKSVAYRNEAVFLEGVAEYPFGLLSAGARYDRHEKFNPAFSPRLAWTRIFGRLHLKAIYNKAFKAPGIDNLDSNPDLRPEKTTVTEFETGYKATDNFFLSANIYDIRINDPIIFDVTTGVQKYVNYRHTGTRGFDLTTRLKKDWGYADITYSHYAAAANKVDAYDAGAGSSALLAFPRNKFTLNSSVKLSSGLSANPSAVYYAGRRGYYAAGSTKRFKDVLLANVNFAANNLLGGRLELALGVYDIFNSGYSYLQPYDGGHAPLPGPSREIRTRLSYKF
jgi:outer membrane cobalamin receptor